MAQLLPGLFSATRLTNPLLQPVALTCAIRVVRVFVWSTTSLSMKMTALPSLPPHPHQGGRGSSWSRSAGQRGPSPPCMGDGGFLFPIAGPHAADGARCLSHALGLPATRRSVARDPRIVGAARETFLGAFLHVPACPTTTTSATGGPTTQYHTTIGDGAGAPSSSSSSSSSYFVGASQRRLLLDVTQALFCGRARPSSVEEGLLRRPCTHSCRVVGVASKMPRVASRANGGTQK